jgi:hypothetical protein
MSEINLIHQYCCISSKEYYNDGLVSGYLLGLITIIIILAFTEIINNINENYIFKDDEQAEAKKDN